MTGSYRARGPTGPCWEQVELEDLYARYSHSVFRRARTLLGNADAARDAMQEVFLRALRAEERQAFVPNPQGWLYRTTTNLCLNGLRDSKRRGELLSAWKPHQISTDPAESRLAVRCILERVPEDLRDVAIYYYVDELSHEEIASLMGVSRRTVGNRLATFHELVRELAR
jgi:RNA polymerase sigma factor (sigma-70 family)